VDFADVRASIVTPLKARKLIAHDQIVQYSATALVRKYVRRLYGRTHTCVNSETHFKKTGKFLSGDTSISLDLDASPSPVVALAIIDDTAFPVDTIRLGNLNFKASAGSGDIKFGGGDTKGTVSFSGNGDVRAGLGVYTSSTDMFDDLGGDAKLLDGVTFNDTGVHRYVTLYSSYDIKAAAKGSVALGAGGSVKFGVDGASEGVFAFVRAYDSEPKARTAIADVVESWRLRPDQRCRSIAAGDVGDGGS
jgi:hypothetical protein